MKSLVFLALTSVALLACGGSGSGGNRLRPDSGDATGAAMVRIGDTFVIDGGLLSTSGGPESLPQKISTTYKLLVDHKVALEVKKVSFTSFCAEGAAMEGPFFDLKSGSKDRVTTDKFTNQKAAIAERDFPGKVFAGEHTLTLTVYGRGDCQFRYAGELRVRSDLAVLDALEWDASLTGSWQFRGWEKERRLWDFSSDLVTQQVIDANKQLVTDIDYSPQIDASEIPGKLALTVTAVRQQSADAKLKVDDQLLCIYRVFPGYEDDQAMWISCGSARADTYPTDFSYPLHEYHR